MMQKDTSPFSRLCRKGSIMDRFDLENKISKTSYFADHLRDLSASILEHDLTTDEIVNAIEGLAVLIENHERTLFDTFVQVFQLDGYNPNTDESAFI
jgi:hypothetical protein